MTPTIQALIKWLPSPREFGAIRFTSGSNVLRIHGDEGSGVRGCWFPELALPLQNANPLHLRQRENSAPDGPHPQPLSQKFGQQLIKLAHCEVRIFKRGELDSLEDSQAGSLCHLTGGNHDS
jgi:hypothetical protein